VIELQKNERELAKGIVSADNTLVRNLTPAPDGTLSPPVGRRTPTVVDHKTTFERKVHCDEEVDFTPFCSSSWCCGDRNRLDAAECLGR
jgi:hypothetical protein